ncbi:unnamed protein product [Ascophyllum nodosum]
MVKSIRVHIKQGRGIILTLSSQGLSECANGGHGSRASSLLLEMTQLTETVGIPLPLQLLGCGRRRSTGSSSQNVFHPIFTLSVEDNAVVLLRRRIAYKQHCGPAWVREYFEAYSYLCEYLANGTVTFFSATDSRNAPLSHKRKNTICLIV